MQATLQINESLPVLSCNFEQLKAWAMELAERYAGIVVTEDAIAEVKRDMAEINKAKKAVDEARKEAVRRVSEPIRAFEAQIREVCGIFDDAYGKLSTQVKAFENAQREEKRRLVEALIQEAVDAAYGEAPHLPIPVQEAWLNKSTSLKAVREAVAALIEKDLEEARRRKALEQARQDRAAAMESHVKALNEKHGLDIPVSRFIVGLDSHSEIPLSDMLADIDAVYAKSIETKNRERQAANDAAPAMVSASPDAAVKLTSQPQNAGQSSAEPLEKAEAPAEKRAMSIILEYDVDNEAAVKACLENLKMLCVNFGARYRQE